MKPKACYYGSCFRRELKVSHKNNRMVKFKKKIDTEIKLSVASSGASQSYRCHEVCESPRVAISLRVINDHPRQCAHTLCASHGTGFYTRFLLLHSVSLPSVSVF